MPDCASASAMKSAIGRVAVAVGRRPRAQGRVEGVVADPFAQRLERHRPTDVDRVGEQLRRLPQRPRRRVPQRASRRRVRAAAGCSRSGRGGVADGLRVPPLSPGRKALVEPDVGPGGDADAVAEPLVGELVRDQPRVRSDVVDRPGLGLERIADLGRRARRSPRPARTDTARRAGRRGEGSSGSPAAGASTRAPPSGRRRRRTARRPRGRAPPGTGRS